MANRQKSMFLAIALGKQKEDFAFRNATEERQWDELKAEIDEMKARGIGPEFPSDSADWG